MHRKRKGVFLQLAKGVLVSAAFTIAAMLLLAALLLLLPIGDGLLRALNQAIKLIAIVLGVCAAAPRGSRRGLAMGTAAALIYIIAGYWLYVLLGGACFRASDLLGEMLPAAAAGAVTGCIRANLPARRRTAPRPVSAR